MRSTFNCFVMRKVRVKGRLASCKRKIDDIPVKGNLAVTPAEMARMTAQGVAVSSQIASNFDDGSTNVSFDVPIERVRGMDMVDYWNAEKDARHAVKAHIVANEKKYGDSTIKSSES